MENINSWKDIPWSATEERVFRLQLRIYRAAADQELEKMYKLQKLLISSSSAKFLCVRKVETAKNKFVLAKRLQLDGKSFDIRGEDRAKQMLAYLALCPQWKAWFEASSYEFRPGRSILCISNKPKWVLYLDIAKYFNQINHSYLLQKCQTFPSLQKQIQAWLKAGILDGQEYAFPQMGGIISPLLANIALHGFRKELHQYINSLRGNRRYNRQAFTYVRYADDFVFIHHDKKILEGCIPVVRKFLGLEFHPEKTLLIHTLESYNEGFTFLPVTLIRPSKKAVKEHKQKLREIIKSYRGTTQERLIQKLNPIIRGWALSKQTQVSRKSFQALDQYVFIHLWKWVLKRHPKMSKTKLKNLYWHQIGYRNWVFGVKMNEEVKLELQMHSKLSIQGFAKGKAKDLWQIRR
jgi:RNA-directed DNA polymerase